MFYKDDILTPSLLKGIKKEKKIIIYSTKRFNHLHTKIVTKWLNSETKGIKVN